MLLTIISISSSIILFSTICWIARPRQKLELKRQHSLATMSIWQFVSLGVRASAPIHYLRIHTFPDYHPLLFYRQVAMTKILFVLFLLCTNVILSAEINGDACFERTRKVAQIQYKVDTMIGLARARKYLKIAQNCSSYQRDATTADDHVYEMTYGNWAKFLSNAEPPGLDNCASTTLPLSTDCADRWLSCHPIKRFNSSLFRLSHRLANDFKAESLSVTDKLSSHDDVFGLYTSPEKVYLDAVSRLSDTIARKEVTYIENKNPFELFWSTRAITDSHSSPILPSVGNEMLYLTRSLKSALDAAVVDSDIITRSKAADTLAEVSKVASRASAGSRSDTILEINMLIENHIENSRCSVMHLVCETLKCKCNHSSDNKDCDEQCKITQTPISRTQILAARGRSRSAKFSTVTKQGLHHEANQFGISIDAVRNIEEAQKMLNKVLNQVDTASHVYTVYLSLTIFVTAPLVLTTSTRYIRARRLLFSMSKPLFVLVMFGLLWSNTVLFSQLKDFHFESSITLRRVDTCFSTPKFIPEIVQSIIESCKELETVHHEISLLHATADLSTANRAYISATCAFPTIKPMNFMNSGIDKCFETIPDVINRCPSNLLDSILAPPKGSADDVFTLIATFGIKFACATFGLAVIRVLDPLATNSGQVETQFAERNMLPAASELSRLGMMSNIIMLFSSTVVLILSVVFSL